MALVSDQLEIHSWMEAHPPAAEAQRRLTLGRGGQTKRHLPLEAAWPAQRLVERMRSVRRRHGQHASDSPGAKTVEQRE